MKPYTLQQRIEIVKIDCKNGENFAVVKHLFGQLL